MKQQRQPISYAQAGVDIDAQDEALAKAKRAIIESSTPGVLGKVGLFGGLFDPARMGMGEAVLVASAEKALDDVAASMRAHPEVKSLSVEVHSDSTGDDKYNLRMTEERAKAVLAYLVKKGVEPGRLSYTGWGETKPVAPNTTVDGRAKNRRVELVLSK